MQILTPVQSFECLFDDELINTVIEFTNRYALHRNSDIVVSTTENRSDTHNIMVTEAISKDTFSHIQGVP
nr:unnamed protein product [Callosobruchus chinensis]